MAIHYYRSRFFSSNPTVPLSDAYILKLTLLSATNLPHYKRWSGQRMKVYAEASLDGGAVQKSRVDGTGVETNPTWDFKADFDITESTCRTGGKLVVKVYCERSCLSDKCICEFEIIVSSLFDSWLDSENATTVAPVEEALDGRLNITYAFGIRG